MTISRSDWLKYIRKLSAIDRKAADAMQFWMDENPDADVDELVYTAHLLTDRYGEAAASLACEMYDATAAAQGAAVPPAEPAETATYDETSKAVRGTIKNQRNTVPATVGRLVKQAGADTMLKNAARDGAEWAWVPNGDTCAFCMMLASNGWQRQGRKAARGQHAEHIHANCDCTYAVRFDGKSTVEGYGDGEAYRERYYGADLDHWNTPDGKPPAGNSTGSQDLWKQRLNAMRRAEYKPKEKKT